MAAAADGRTEAQLGEHPGDVVGLVGELHQALRRTAARRAGHDVDRRHLVFIEGIAASSVCPPEACRGEVTLVIRSTIRDHPTTRARFGRPGRTGSV